MHGSKGPNSAAGKHCVMHMHHMKSLEAIDEVMWCVKGAWGRHNGPIQPVWCTQLWVLISQMEHMNGSKGPNSAAGKAVIIFVCATPVIWCFVL